MNIELEIFKEFRKRNTPPEAYTMSNGTLYFNAAAIKQFGLRDEVYFNIASNKSDKDDQNMYLIKSNKKDRHAAKITKGNYLNSTPFFNQLDIDFRKHSYHYSIRESSYKGKKMLILKFEDIQQFRKKRKSK